MLLPSVAIIGRPNVGKSSLFNRLIGHPMAIVDSYAGVTRDRILHEVQRDGAHFDLVDTGGIGIIDEHQLEADVNRQIHRAIEHADHILFVCDGREGITALDEDIAKQLRPYVDRVTLVVNKIDYEGLEANTYEFSRLGFSQSLPVSAHQAIGLSDLCEYLAELLPDPEVDIGDSAPSEIVKICLAGRRNVGKSSLTNALCGEERVIVADYAGTTRDAIDVPIVNERHGDFLLIDTAGLRRKKQIAKDLEFYAACRSERSIRRSDVILLVLDAADEIGTVDKKIAHYCVAACKPTIIVVNKWDIAEVAGAGEAAYREWLYDRLPGLRFAPIVFTCALTGTHVESILATARELHHEFYQRVETSEVNRLLETAVQRRRPRKIGPNYTKIYYGTQAQTAPPTFLFFVNRTDWVEAGYGRYLENFLRKHLNFKRVPYRVVFKSRDSQYHEHHDAHVRTDARSKAEHRSTLLLPGGGTRKNKGKGNTGSPGKTGPKRHPGKRHRP